MLNISINSTVVPEKNLFYQDILLGCFLSIIGNFLISLALNIQKYTHIKNESLEKPVVYYKTPFWWCGVCMMIFGEVGNFIGYGFAPASLVASLGTTSVIANMFIAVILLNEQLYPEDIFGTVLSVIGAFLVVSFSRKKEPVLDSNELLKHISSHGFVVYSLIMTLLLTVFLMAHYILKRNNIFLLILITNIFSSITIIAAKGLSGMLNLTISGIFQLNQIIFYIFFVLLTISAIMQIVFLNKAMKSYTSTVVVPTNFVFFTLSAIAAGNIFYEEFYGFRVIQIIMFFFGCMLSFLGVFFITLNRLTNVLESQGSSFVEEYNSKRIGTPSSIANSDASANSHKEEFYSTGKLQTLGMLSLEEKKIQPPSKYGSHLDEKNMMYTHSRVPAVVQSPQK